MVLRTRLIAIILTFCIIPIVFAVTSCEEAGKYIVRNVVEEVTDTIIHESEGRPWQIIDSLRQEIVELKVQLDSCK